MRSRIFKKIKSTFLKKTNFSLPMLPPGKHKIGSVNSAISFFRIIK